MPKTELTYPEWVQEYRTQGTTVKKKGDSYYLYKRTSKRVYGKKYPQPVDTYIGIITPEGLIKTGKKKVSLTDIEVWEYGYSNAMVQLCPDDWKRPLGDDWEDMLKIIITQESPVSYLKRSMKISDPDDLKYQLAVQKSSLYRRFVKKYHVDPKELEILKSIYLIVMKPETVVSRILPEQRALLEKLGITLGGV